MGAACCCLRPENIEDYVNPNSSVYRNCTCLSCFLQNFVNVVCPMIVVPLQNVIYYVIALIELHVTYELVVSHIRLKYWFLTFIILLLTVC